MANNKVQKGSINVKYSKYNKHYKSNASKIMINNKVKLGLLNIRSIISKYDDVYQLLMDGLDIFVVVKSWHGSSDHISVKMSMPPGYVFVDFLRSADPYHGGLIIFFRSIYKYVKIDLPVLTSFEAIVLKLTIDKINIILFAIYRPGSDLVSSLFFQELSSMLEYVASLGNHLILLGDFNIHVERLNDTHTISLNDLFDVFSMRNVIDRQTHIFGGTIDLIIAGNHTKITDIKIQPSGVYSDHSLITVCLPVSRPIVKKITKHLRSWKCMDRSKLILLINDSLIGKPCDFDDATEAAEFFNNELLRIANIVAPIRMIKVKQITTAPWYDSE